MQNEKDDIQTDWSYISFLKKDIVFYKILTIISFFGIILFFMLGKVLSNIILVTVFNLFLMGFVSGYPIYIYIKWKIYKEFNQNYNIRQLLNFFEKID